MNKPLEDIVNLSAHPIGDAAFAKRCKEQLDSDGVLVLPEFLTAAAINSTQQDGVEKQHLAYYTANSHNIYLTPPDSDFASNHPRNREVSSSKGCITTNQIPAESVLHDLYNSDTLRTFLCTVLGEEELHEYADPLSSINLHYASVGQELGWHYDNSSFAITLMIQTPEAGGVFEYVKDVRDADRGEMNFSDSEQVLDNKVTPQTLTMEAGALVLFRGRNSMHRVTPTKGDRTRMLVVLAYNTEPGISLSESARMTFFGRLK